MAEEKKDKGFTVVDRRIGAEDAPAGPPASPEAIPLGDKTAPCETNGACDQAAVADARAAYQGTAESEAPITFPSFLLSLHASALIHLGLIPDPASKNKIYEPGLARQNIGLLEMLQDKTEGRRTPEETGLLENILYELRLAYVETAKSQGSKGEKQ